MNKRIIIKVLSAAGALLILSSIGLVVFNVLDAARAEEEARAVETVLEARREEMKPAVLTVPEQTGSFDDKEKQPVLPKEMAAVEIDGELYIGTLEVPSLDMKLPVISDWDMNKLKKAPCRYSGSYYTDDLVLCGHNYRGGRHFNPLKNIADGADVYFTTVNDETIHYRVLRTEKLFASQVEEMITKTDWDLTLYTCTTRRGDRLTVRCVRVKD